MALSYVIPFRVVPGSPRLLSWKGQKTHDGSGGVVTAYMYFPLVPTLSRLGAKGFLFRSAEVTAQLGGGGYGEFEVGLYGENDPSFVDPFLYQKWLVNTASLPSGGYHWPYIVTGCWPTGGPPLPINQLTLMARIIQGNVETMVSSYYITAELID